MAKDRLFTLTRRDFLTVGLAALATACSSPQDTTPNPIVISSPSVRPSQAPKPLSPEEEMMEKVLNTALSVWLDTLSKKQTDNDIFPTTLETAILNSDIWKGNYQHGQTDISPDNPLRTRFKATEFSREYGEGTKFIGEMNFSQIKAGVQNKTTAADAANKEWHGTATVSFLRQARAIFDRRRNTNIAAIQSWLNEPVKPEDFPPFAKWEAESRQFDVIFTNGQFSGVGSLSFPNAGGLPMLKNLQLPSELLVQTSSPFGDCYNPGSWCKNVSPK